MVKSRFQLAMLGSLARSTCDGERLVNTFGFGKLYVRIYRRLGSSYLAIACVDAGKVDFADEGNVGRGVGVLRTTVDLERVDAVLVDAL